jgi:hypothetical protein
MGNIFGRQDTMRHEFIAQGSAVDKESYKIVLARLREALCPNRPEIWELLAQSV